MTSAIERTVGMRHSGGGGGDPEVGGFPGLYRKRRARTFRCRRRIYGATAATRSKCRRPLLVPSLENSPRGQQAIARGGVGAEHAGGAQG